MNFTSIIKNELMNKKMSKNETIGFVSGFLYCFNNEEVLKVKVQNKDYFDFIIQQFKKIEIEFNEEKGILFVNDLKNKLNEINPNNATSFLAGIFFASGSISNLDSSAYHLEISFKIETHCDSIQEFSKKHIQFNKIQNKNNYVLYLKRNESIQDFLNIIGATKAYFNFIDSIIERDMKNQITRIFNLDLHNQNRLVDSNQNFNENLEYIKKHHLESEFKSEQLIFYEFKKDNPYLSLSQLSEELMKEKNINKTKSGLNHWLIKLRNVCEEHENKNK